jgi:hypothetical protein
VASFAGANLALVEEWSTTAAPNDAQINAYNGVNGLERLDLGGRGGETQIKGVLFASDPYSLASLKQNFITLQVSGIEGLFIDPEGTEWAPVVLVIFRTVGKRMILAGAVGICQRYEAELLHL